MKKKYEALLLTALCTALMLATATISNGQDPFAGVRWSSPDGFPTIQEDAGELAGGFRPCFYYEFSQKGRSGEYGCGIRGQVREDVFYALPELGDDVDEISRKHIDPTLCNEFAKELPGNAFHPSVAGLLGRWLNPNRGYQVTYSCPRGGGDCEVIINNTWHPFPHASPDSQGGSQTTDIHEKVGMIKIQAYAIFPTPFDYDGGNPFPVGDRVTFDIDRIEIVFSQADKPSAAAICRYRGAAVQGITFDFFRFI